MPRRPDPRQLDLPHVSVGVRPPAEDVGSGPAEPSLAVPRDPWADVRFDGVVAALLAPDGVSARRLARDAGCSPDTLARTRKGRTPRPALRVRLIGLAWDRLDPEALAATGLPPEPADNLRWHARERPAHAHAFRLAPATSRETVSLCGAAHAHAVQGAWPVEPDQFAAICPTCLARGRER